MILLFPLSNSPFCLPLSVLAPIGGEGGSGKESFNSPNSEGDKG